MIILSSEIIMPKLLKINSHKNSINEKITISSFFYQKLFFSQLKSLTIGSIKIDCGGVVHHFGNKNDKNTVLLKIINNKFFRLVVYKGHLGFAESFGQGYCTTSQLTQLLTLFSKNFAVVDNVESGITWFFNKFQYFYYNYFEKNTVQGSKKNIHAHYDLGNDLFMSFLDKNMQYSSALYANKDLSLDEAQVLKMAAICDRLDVSSEDHVLEIGSGWGGLAIYMAKKIGCKVTTITISNEQFEYAKNKITNENLDSLITIKLCDYRELNGTYDKIVSIEMIEAVGEKYYQTYFDTCNKLIKADGLFLMQAILIADHEYDKAKKSVDFIKRYIFPGSNIPSLNSLNLSANIANLKLKSYFDMTHDYVQTLAQWQIKFNEHSEALLKLGYDDYFQNIWNFYFSYCQAGFIVEHIRDAHLVFKKR